MSCRIGAGLGVNGLVAVVSKVEIHSHTSWSAPIRPGVLPCQVPASFPERYSLISNNGTSYSANNCRRCALMKAQGTSDKALGGLMLLAASTVFIYYTIWALLLVRGGLCRLIGISHISQKLQPFFATSNTIHSFFPPREWAVRLPAFLLVVGLTGIGLFVGRTIMKEREKQAVKARMRAA